MDTYRLGKLHEELSKLEQWKHLFESGSIEIIIESLEDSIRVLESKISDERRAIAGQFLKFLEMIGEHPKLASEFRKAVLSTTAEPD